MEKPKDNAAAAALSAEKKPVKMASKVATPTQIKSATTVQMLKTASKRNKMTVATTAESPEDSKIFGKSPFPSGSQSGKLVTVSSSEATAKQVTGNEPSEQLTTIDSNVSIGFEIGNDMEDRTQTLVIRDGPEPFKSILRTVIGFAIRCPHGKMPLQKVKDHVGYWFPYAYTSENAKYLDTASDVYDFFATELANDDKSRSQISQKSIEPMQLCRRDPDKAPDKRESVPFLSNYQLFSIYRFQIPSGQFVTRYIYLAQWAVDPKTSGTPISCCKDTANLQWLSIEAIVQESKQGSLQLMDQFWGYEIIMACPILQQMAVQGSPGHFTMPLISEFASVEVMKYLSRQRQGNASASFSQMLQEAKFAEKDVLKIYCDYVQHCFPSATMTYCSFYEYFTKIGFLQFDDASLRHIFRAMNFKNKHSMLFNEFLLGLAALDSNAQNSKLRFTYIFRFYDRNSDGFLDEEDFKRMVSDIRYKANLSCDANDVANDVKSRLSILKVLDESRRISYKAFLNEASHIGGIIHLFRTNKAILEAINSRHAYELITNRNGKPFGANSIGTCAKCKPKTYTLAYHTTKLNAQGRIDEPIALVDLPCGDLDKELQFTHRADETKLKHSREIVFNETSVANRVITTVRRMADFSKVPKEQQKEVSQFVLEALSPSILTQLCKDVKSILLIEPRVLKVNTPCIVLGDLHGNIGDLLTYEDQLWPLAPSANSPNVLFLGDFVDRGDHSIEVVSYLFAMKLLAPTKFFLLRGNHETRELSRKYTFYKECTLKYGLESGESIFEAFNLAFDCLPLVGIIDESIYCAHGGIPFSVGKTEDLHKIPCPLSDPYAQSKAAWEILWSDPVTNEEYSEVCQFHNQASDSGFADNIRRGTAHYFTEKALRGFLKNNGLTHVIRAHELETDGYRFHHSGLLITIFSSSRYCGFKNRSAAVFVDSRENEGFLKVISLDT